MLRRAACHPAAVFEVQCQLGNSFGKDRVRWRNVRDGNLLIVSYMIWYEELA